MSTNRFTISPAAMSVTTENGLRVVFVDLDDKRIFNFGGSAPAIWNHLLGSPTAAELRERLEAEFPSFTAEDWREVEEFLGTLVEQSLVVLRASP